MAIVDVIIEGVKAIVDFIFNIIFLVVMYGIGKFVLQVVTFGHYKPNIDNSLSVYIATFVGFSALFFAGYGFVLLLSFFSG